MPVANEARRQTADLLLTTIETTDRSAQEGAPRAYAPSSMTTATFTEPNVGAATIGQFVVPEDGDARGQVRQVKSRAAAVATVDKPWTSVTGVTRLRAWRPAWRPFRITSSGGVGGDTHNCTDHANLTNEPDGFWGKTAADTIRRKYHLVGIAGVNAGKASQIVDFTSATGQATVSPVISQSSADDLFEICKPLYVEGPINASANPNYIKRRVTGFAAAGQPVKGVYAGTIGFDLAVKALESGSDTATAPGLPAEIGDLFTDHFTETRNKGSTVVSVGGATVNVTGGHGVRFAVGALALFANGQVGGVLSVSTDTLTFPTGHLTTSELGTTVIQNSVFYKRRLSGFLGRAFHYFRGGLFRQTFSGCMPTITLKVARDGMTTFTFAYGAAEVYEYNLARWAAADAAFPLAIDAKIASDAKASRFLLGGTRVLLDNFEFELGLKPGLRKATPGQNQSDSHFMDMVPATGKFSILADEDDVSGYEATIDKLQDRQGLDLLLHKGTVSAETFGLWCPQVVMTKAMANYKDGQGHYDCEFEVPLPQAMPGNAFGATLPDYVFGWM